VSEEKNERNSEVGVNGQLAKEKNVGWKKKRRCRAEWTGGDIEGKTPQTGEGRNDTVMHLLDTKSFI